MAELAGLALKGLVAGLSMTLAGCASAEPAAEEQPCSIIAETAPEAVEAAVSAGAASGELVTALARCLGDPDPEIRDALAYGSLAELMRAGAVSLEDRRWLLETLTANLGADASDPDGTLKPFAALVLSEVARTDRVEPWMTEEERTGLVETGARYVEGVSDYRGYVDGEGWRHGVAHGADLLMQLSLNPEIGKPEADRILAAIGKKISTGDAPAYTFDEPRRLARPLLFLTQNELFAEEELTAWFETLADPAPLQSWNDAFRSERALARRHNLRAFGYVVLVSVTENEDEALKRLRPGALLLLSKIP